jgi:hypothetical protein
MKIALCFIISYDHSLNKETIWREWIDNLDKHLVNIYVYYKDITQIKSPWLKQYAIPCEYIRFTSYYHVIPAYIGLMKYALSHDKNNQWLCFLTDSCCPIISPSKFQYLFFQYYSKTIMTQKPAWWNVHYHRRANLAKINKQYHLANEPWFVMRKEDVKKVLQFSSSKNAKTRTLFQLICEGGLANESLFAIVLRCYGAANETINESIYITNWNKMSSATSPYVFKGRQLEEEKNFINEELTKNKYIMFIRKVSTEFPNDVLKEYIGMESMTPCEKKMLLYYTTVNKCHNVLQIIYYSPLFRVFLTATFCYFFVFQCF